MEDDYKGINTLREDQEPEGLDWAAAVVQILTENEQLTEKVAVLESKLSSEENKVAELEAKLERFVGKIMDVSLRVAEIEEKRSGPTEIELKRVQDIRRMLSNAPGHRMTYAELRGRIGVSMSGLSGLIKILYDLYPAQYETHKNDKDKRSRELLLKPKSR